MTETTLAEELEYHFHLVDGNDECDHCGKETRVWTYLSLDGEGEGYYCDDCALKLLIDGNDDGVTIEQLNVAKYVVLYDSLRKVFLRLPFGVQKMSYNNELILCPSWGYDGGKESDLNDPDNWEIVWFENTKKKRSQDVVR
jgi:DNA-directed RNA polymerase subunit RPC12/RpoP